MAHCARPRRVANSQDLRPNLGPRRSYHVTSRHDPPDVRGTEAAIRSGLLSQGQRSSQACIVWRLDLGPRLPPAPLPTCLTCLPALRGFLTDEWVLRNSFEHPPRNDTNAPGPLWSGAFVSLPPGRWCDLRKKVIPVDEFGLQVCRRGSAITRDAALLHAVVGDYAGVSARSKMEISYRFTPAGSAEVGRETSPRTRSVFSSLARRVPAVPTVPGDACGTARPVVSRNRPGAVARTRLGDRGRGKAG